MITTLRLGLIGTITSKLAAGVQIATDVQQNPDGLFGLDLYYLDPKHHNWQEPCEEKMGNELIAYREKALIAYREKVWFNLDLGNHPEKEFKQELDRIQAAYEQALIKCSHVDYKEQYEWSFQCYTNTIDYCDGICDCRMSWSVDGPYGYACRCFS